jgi:Hypoxia induced protein conserved region
MITYLIPIALTAVSIALLLGLWNMARGGSANRSQTLMRWRVGLQFAAIILLLLAVWFSRNH